jgi:hypothetical protein
MRTLAEKLAEQQAPNGNKLPPGETFLWFMGAKSALQLVNEDVGASFAPWLGVNRLLEEIDQTLDVLFKEHGYQWREDHDVDVDTEEVRPAV